MSNDILNERVTADSVQREYDLGRQFNESIDLYDTVQNNENFYLGKQWEGFKTDVIQPVTMNFMRRVLSYFQSMIVSEDIGVQVRKHLQPQDDMLADIYKREIDRVLENTKFRSKSRESLRDTCVDADGCMYFWFDPDVPNGQAVPGEIKVECIMNTNIIFGDTSSSDIQEQPYILLVRRRHCATVRKEAKANYVQDWESIASSTSSEFANEDGTDRELVTEITRFWKEDVWEEYEVAPVPGLEGMPMKRWRKAGKSVHCMTVCGKVVTKPDTDLGLSLYPVSYMTWEQRKNSYHGVAPMTEVIPTQIAVNKLLTYIMTFVQGSAFPTTIYDVNKLTRGRPKPGAWVGVSGGVQDAIMTVQGGSQLPSSIVGIFDTIINTTRDFMGASDAALGNIRTDNASAIIAVQEATQAPLLLQKLAFGQFVEDGVRIIIDMIGTCYGTREVRASVTTKDPATGQKSKEEQIVAFDFSQNRLHNLEIDVEIGASSYWSELMVMQTAENMLQQGIFTDLTDYVEALPQKFLPDDKGELLRKLREKQAMQEQQQAMQAGMPGMPEQQQPMPPTSGLV